MIDKRLTLALLSCGRFDLLRLTVESLFRSMAYPVHEILVTEDSGLPDAEAQLKSIVEPLGRPTRYLFHGTRHGVAFCMDEIYRRVQTPYVLHLEDDWVCTAARSDFVERSIAILDNDPKIVQVWLRPPLDCGGHPLEAETFETGAARYRLLTTSWEGVWHGYSNNPCVRRIREYRLLPGGYAALGGKNSGLNEANISEFYYRRGYRGAVLCEPDGGFVHIGVSRSVEGHEWQSSPDIQRRYDVLKRRAIELRLELEAIRSAQVLPWAQSDEGAAWHNQKPAIEPGPPIALIGATKLERLFVAFRS